MNGSKINKYTVLGQFPYSVIKENYHRLNGNVILETDLTMVFVSFKMPLDLNSPVCEPGYKWIICETEHSDEILNILTSI